MIITIPMVILKEGGTYIALYPSLDIATQGKTVKHAKHMFHELVTLFVEDNKKQGTLKEVLVEAGFTHRDETWAAPEIVHVSAVTVSVG
jgi:predicted RNase H-like HicB family nuclease